MSRTTEPFFVVSSGRSGTAMLHKALSASAGVEMHHEYMVHIVQPLAVRRYLGLIDGARQNGCLPKPMPPPSATAKRSIGAILEQVVLADPGTGRAASASKIRPSGARRAQSRQLYFHKLGDECYDDRSTAILRRPYRRPAAIPRRRRRRNIGGRCRAGTIHPPTHSHASTNSSGSLALGGNQSRDPGGAGGLRRRKACSCVWRICAEPARCANFMTFLIFVTQRIRVFARPHNVNRPVDKLLDEKQRSNSKAIAGRMLARLGYASRAEYVVNY